MRKSTKIDFHVISPESPDIEFVLRKLDGLPINSPKRTTQPTDDWVRLVRGTFAPDEAGYHGDMMRISMAPPGFRAKIDGEIEAINFDADEGLAECSAFYYDFESRILVLQRNAKAVSVGQFTHYMQEVGDFQQDIDISPVLRPTDMGKVTTLTQIRKIHISANIVDVLPTLDDVDSATQSVIQNSVLAESPGFELVLKAGREKDASLNQAVVIETLESWLKIHENFADEDNEIVKKIEVCGTDDTGDRVEFDMLKDKMYHRAEYEWLPDDEQLWQNRHQKIQQAWDLNHKTIKKTLAAAEQ